MLRTSIKIIGVLNFGTIAASPLPTREASQRDDTSAMIVSKSTSAAEELQVFVQIQALRSPFRQHFGPTLVRCPKALTEANSARRPLCRVQRCALPGYKPSRKHTPSLGRGCRPPRVAPPRDSSSPAPADVLRQNLSQEGCSQALEPRPAHASTPETATRTHHHWSNAVWRPLRELHNAPQTMMAMLFVRLASYSHATLWHDTSHYSMSGNCRCCCADYPPRLGCKPAAPPVPTLTSSPLVARKLAPTWRRARFESTPRWDIRRRPCPGACMSMHARHKDGTSAPRVLRPSLSNRSATPWA